MRRRGGTAQARRAWYEAGLAVERVGGLELGEFGFVPLDGAADTAFVEGEATEGPLVG